MYKTTKGENAVGRTTLNSNSLIEAGWRSSRAVKAGPWIFVSATSGTDYDTGALSEDVVEQGKQAVANVRHALAEMDASMDEVVRYHLIVPDVNDLAKLRDVIGEAFAGGRPVHGVLCCPLPKPTIKVEIEATALKRS